MELAALTIHELQDKIRAGEVTAMQITRSVFERIDALEEKVHSYISLTKKEALAAAELADRDIKRGDIKPLTGIPVALKDIICTREYRQRVLPACCRTIFRHTTRRL